MRNRETHSRLRVVATAGRVRIKLPPFYLKFCAYINPIPIMNNNNTAAEKTPGDAFAASKEAVQRLSLNDSGFVFDPVCGRSYTVNKTGLRLLAMMQETASLGELQQQILMEFDVPAYTAERDVLEFIDQIRRNIK